MSVVVQYIVHQSKLDVFLTNGFDLLGSGGLLGIEFQVFHCKGVFVIGILKMWGEEHLWWTCRWENHFSRT